MFFKTKHTAAAEDKAWNIGSIRVDSVNTIAIIDSNTSVAVMNVAIEPSSASIKVSAGGSTSQVQVQVQVHKNDVRSLLLFLHDITTAPQLKLYYQTAAGIVRIKYYTRDDSNLSKRANLVSGANLARFNRASPEVDIGRCKNLKIKHGVTKVSSDLLDVAYLTVLGIYGSKVLAAEIAHLIAEFTWVKLIEFAGLFVIKKALLGVEHVGEKLSLAGLDRMFMTYVWRLEQDGAMKHFFPLDTKAKNDAAIEFWKFGLTESCIDRSMMRWVAQVWKGVFNGTNVSLFAQVISAVVASDDSLHNLVCHAGSDKPIIHWIRDILGYTNDLSASFMLRHTAGASMEDFVHVARKTLATKVATEVAITAIKGIVSVFTPFATKTVLTWFSAAKSATTKNAKVSETINQRILVACCVLSMCISRDMPLYTDYETQSLLWSINTMCVLLVRLMRRLELWDLRRPEAMKSAAAVPPTTYASNYVGIDKTVANIVREKLDTAFLANDVQRQGDFLRLCFRQATMVDQPSNTNATANIDAAATATKTRAANRASSAYLNDLRARTDAFFIKTVPGLEAARKDLKDDESVECRVRKYANLTAIRQDALCDSIAERFVIHVRRTGDVPKALNQVIRTVEGVVFVESSDVRVVKMLVHHGDAQPKHTTLSDAVCKKLADICDVVQQYTKSVLVSQAQRHWSLDSNTVAFAKDWTLVEMHFTWDRVEAPRLSPSLTHVTFASSENFDVVKLVPPLAGDKLLPDKAHDELMSLCVRHKYSDVSTNVGKKDKHVYCSIKFDVANQASAVDGVNAYWTATAGGFELSVPLSDRNTFYLTQVGDPTRSKRTVGQTLLKTPVHVFLETKRDAA